MYLINHNKSVCSHQNYLILIVLKVQSTFILDIRCVSLYVHSFIWLFYNLQNISQRFANMSGISPANVNAKQYFALFYVHRFQHFSQNIYNLSYHKVFVKSWLCNKILIIFLLSLWCDWMIFYLCNCQCELKCWCRCICPLYLTLGPAESF